MRMIPFELVFIYSFFFPLFVRDESCIYDKAAVIKKKKCSAVFFRTGKIKALFAPFFYVIIVAGS